MSAVEEQIRRAIEAGLFDNLPGKGKPLSLEQNPFEDPEWRLAHHLLRSNGFTLPWIEKRREIEASIQSARDSLRRAAEWCRAPNKDAAQAAQAEIEWQQAVEQFRQRVAEINRQILTYNLQAPSVHFHIRSLSVERELELTSSSPSDTLSD